MKPSCPRMHTDRHGRSERVVSADAFVGMISRRNWIVCVYAFEKRRCVEVHPCKFVKIRGLYKSTTSIRENSRVANSRQSKPQRTCEVLVLMPASQGSSTKLELLELYKHIPCLLLCDRDIDIEKLLDNLDMGRGMGR